MKLFIPSFRRPDLHCTFRHFEGTNIDWYVLVHTADEHRGYRIAGLVPPERLILTRAPLGLVNHRNWAIDNMVEDGEWFLFASDDITKITMLEEPFYSNDSEIDVSTKNSTLWGRRFAKQAGPREVERICDELLQKAIAEDCYYAGFSAFGNSLFRAKKWKRDTFVDGRLFLMRKTELRFDPRVVTMDDYAFTAQNLSTSHGTLVNAWVEPVARRYTAGGIGTYDERLPAKRADCAYLIERYPHLFRYNSSKKSGAPDAELSLIPSRRK